MFIQITKRPKEIQLIRRRLFSLAKEPALVNHCKKCYVTGPERLRTFQVLQPPGKIFSKSSSALDVTRQEPGSIQQLHNIHRCGTETVSL